MAHSFEEAALWNPTTDELKLLPQSSVPRPPRTRKSVFCHGFGFDHHNDYKVIRFIEYKCLDDYTENILVELYLLKTDSWKEVVYPYFPMTPETASMITYFLPIFMGTSPFLSTVVIN
ncbi:F-box protein [Striga asiatica]|uniref:F-box protein n=1 Tax=Striga asiatica TaxID=4170 RepID=A0A5A7PNW4_STRAF|nr:F-box protein [Striga asiatica]